jgi:hypothetical protein
VPLERLVKLEKKKSNDLIGNRSHDLPACSIVPQPTTLPRALERYLWSIRNVCVIYINKISATGISILFAMAFRPVNFSHDTHDISLYCNDSNLICIGHFGISVCCVLLSFFNIYFVDIPNEI